MYRRDTNSLPEGRPSTENIEHSSYAFVDAASFRCFPAWCWRANLGGSPGNQGIWAAHGVRGDMVTVGVGNRLNGDETALATRLLQAGVNRHTHLNTDDRELA